MECSYDVEFVSGMYTFAAVLHWFIYDVIYSHCIKSLIIKKNSLGFLLGDPTIVTLDNFTYLMNGWGEYTLMDVPSENFTLQVMYNLIFISHYSVLSIFLQKSQKNICKDVLQKI